MAPSLLAADFTDLRTDVASLEAAGVDLLHLDVMDGHFVPNISFGPFVCEHVRRCTDLVLDAHLMISRPHEYLEAFAAARVDAITIHVEADSPVGPTLARIGELGLKRGLTLNPGTPVTALSPYLADVDLVLVMSVEPGFGGQTFAASAVEKIAALTRTRSERGLDFAVSVDGGITTDTAPAVREAGADILVSGTHLCRSADRAATVRALRGEAGGG